MMSSAPTPSGRIYFCDDSCLREFTRNEIANLKDRIHALCPDLDLTTHENSPPAVRASPIADCEEKADKVEDVMNKSIKAFNLGYVPRRGLLIVFEGADRSGKTTQAEKLTDHLRTFENPAVMMRFPDRTSPTGIILDRFLKHQKHSIREEHQAEVTHALFACNRWEKIESIFTLLSRGIDVVVDRYAWSGVVYSKGVYTLSSETTAPMEVGLIRPDVVIQPSVDEKKLSNRAAFGEERYETAELQSKVNLGFHNYQSLDYWKTVDGNQSIDAVHADVLKIVTDARTKASTKDMKVLRLSDIQSQCVDN